MTRPSDHLLRTLAPVPPSCNILEVGCGDGHHTEPLLQLGFPVHACAVDERSVRVTRERVTALVGEETAQTCVQQVAPDGFAAYPDDAFHWIVAHTPDGYLDGTDRLTDWARTMRRLLIPGGWLYLVLAQPDPATNGVSTTAPTPERVTTRVVEAGLAPAEAAAETEEEGRPLVRGIFRLPPDVTSP